MSPGTKSLRHRLRISKAMRKRKITMPDLSNADLEKMTLAELDAEEDRLRARCGKLLAHIRHSGRKEFADKVEQHMIKNDLLPRKEKQN